MRAARFTIAGLASAALLALSAWPGVLMDLFFFGIMFSFVVVPAGIILWIALGFLPRRPSSPGTGRPRDGKAIAIIALGTLLMMIFSVPGRIGFLLSRSAMDRVADAAPPFDPLQRRSPLDTRVGAYFVDEYAVDRRGGVYLRVYSGTTGLGPDTMSYGFARRPNSEGSPFGNSAYSAAHIAGEWYWFRASNDW